MSRLYFRKDRRLRSLLQLALVPALVVAFFTAPLSATDPPPSIPVEPPQLSFAPTTVTISKLTPGGKAAWIGVSREAEDDGVTVYQRAAVAVDDDGDGTATVDLGREYTPSSIWAAVDLSSGLFALTATNGTPVTGIAYPGGTLGTTKRLSFTGVDSLWILLVRQGVGAWSVRVGDGGEADSDGEANGQIGVGLASFEPLGDAPPPPEALASGDLVIAMDPDRLEAFSAQVSPPALGASEVGR